MHTELELTSLRLSFPLLVLLCVGITISFAPRPTIAASQSENGQLNTALMDLRGAELAGARPSEMQPLIGEMNSVVSLRTQLNNLPPQESTRRAQLLEEINGTLSSVDAQANQLETTASQRTYLDHVLTYTYGIIGAAIGTLAYCFVVMLYTEARIRRTFRMKIIPK